RRPDLAAPAAPRIRRRGARGRQRKDDTPRPRDPRAVQREGRIWPPRPPHKRSIAEREDATAGMKREDANGKNTHPLRRHCEEASADEASPERLAPAQPPSGLLPASALPRGRNDE